MSGNISIRIALALSFAGLLSACSNSPETLPASQPSHEVRPSPAYSPEELGWTIPRDQDDPRLVEPGRQIAQGICSSCHAIDATSASPRRDAPPLREVLRTYPSDLLAERFIEGVRVGHDDMPRFDFNVLAADSLIAYLKSIAVEQ